MYKNIILAPHCDDELIGCYSVLKKNEETLVLYFYNDNSDRLDEALYLRRHFKDSISILDISCNSIINTSFDIFTSILDDDTLENFFNGKIKVYAPDPTFEFHPDHRDVGNFALSYLRRYGIDVTFYSINMNTPYIFQLNKQDREMKEHILNVVYPSQRDLWRYEKKYVLFEGYCKWLIGL
jgi:hypothetical protein